MKSQIQAQLVDAMRQRDRKRVEALKLIKAELQMASIDAQGDLNKEQELTVLTKMVKSRQSSIEQFTEGNRADLVEQESYEIVVIQEFLPSQLGDAEIREIVLKTIAETGASTMRDMGRVTGLLAKELKGRADMRSVAAMVKEQLQAG